MSSSNPSHLLISRNPPRSPAHPQLAHASTSRHAPSASLPSPRPPFLGRWHHSADELTQTTQHSRQASNPWDPSADRDASSEVEEEDVQVHPSFLPDATMPGNVKVMVGRYEFWCHREVLWFASPFFQGLLQGSWAETNALSRSTRSSAYDLDTSHDVSIPSDLLSLTPTDTDRADQPAPAPAVAEFEQTSGDHTAVTKHDGGSEVAPVHIQPLTDRASDSDEADLGTSSKQGSIYVDAMEDYPNVSDILRELRELPETPVDEIRNIGEMLDESSLTLSEVASGATSGAPTVAVEVDEAGDRRQALAGHTRKLARSRTGSTIRHSFSSEVVPGHRRRVATEATVELHEESASAFQDFLFWAYPHLECKVTWTNVVNLLALAHKLIVPALQKLCDHFLFTHASGRPVMAMSLAEGYGNGELYKEASRFVLDQATWEESEREALTFETRLKLSQRRLWFCERLLKLRSIDVKKEYTCRADCPDPARCQAQLDEKWQQAYNAVVKFGPPRPSVAFRCMRQLETSFTNPSLVMSHPLCETAAKQWVSTLFDRMFQPKLVAASSGTEKYWLYITM
ncbi:hypothetical protein IAU60_004712 [Kwoniella sp. DSM 27419]